MTRRVLIADDEPLARERVTVMLRATPGYEVVAECADGPETVDAILRHAPDILFLDIRMPGLDGFEVLAALGEVDVPPAVVFVTAHDAHAVEAFDVEAADYLLKPFDTERFTRSLARAEARLARGPDDLALGVRAFLETLGTSRAYPERFLVRAASHLYFVRSADIEWIESAANYVRLHIAGRVHMLRDTLKGIATKLPPDRFVRIHRSIIVNVDAIQRLEPNGHGEYRILLADGKRVTSSRGYGSALREMLG